MMKLVAIVLLVSSSYNGCRKQLTQLPPCIQKKIATLQAQPKQNPPAHVEEYVYNGKSVFYFSSDCCDQYNYVYDEDCNVICAPDGGITGKGDGRCADFLEKATHVRTVWKDER